LENAIWQRANAAVATKRKASSSLVTIDACAFLSRLIYVEAKDFQGDDEPSGLWRGQVSYHKGVMRDHPEWQAKLERPSFPMWILPEPSVGRGNGSGRLSLVKKPHHTARLPAGRPGRV
jgi:hypothetical protein